MSVELIRPEWPAPANVFAVSTTRGGGVSKGVYASFNLGSHAGDDSAAVAENRRRLLKALKFEQEPFWLKQVHGTRVARLDGHPVDEPADAAVSGVPQQACVVMTADCMPVLFCDRAGSIVAAAHAGWRGLSAGVLETTLAAMQMPGTEILAWLGPAIGPEVYEVGEEVRQAFVTHETRAERAFRAHGQGKWLCDLYMLARQRLSQAGVEHIYGGGFCTYTDKQRFFSYRRDGECGRMASLICLGE